MEDHKKQRQIEIAERLQEKLLLRWEELLDSGNLSSTDAATLTRFLQNNGWSVDPARLPKGLQGILTAKVDPSSILGDEEDFYAGGRH